MAEDEKDINAEVDDWLKDFEDSEKAEGGDSQSELEELFGAGGGEESAEAEAGAVVDEELTSGELDQSDIDALLGTPSSKPAEQEGEAPAEAEGEAGPIDQADIDALFASVNNAPGGEEKPQEAAAEQPEAPAEEAAQAEEEGAAEQLVKGQGVDQADLDQLLAGSETEAPFGETTGDSEVPDQSDIDQLFAEMGPEETGAETGSEAFKAEEVDFTELLQEGTGTDESFTLTEDDFGFTDSEQETAAAEEHVFADEEATVGLPDFMEETKDTGPAAEGEKEKKRPFLRVPPTLQDRRLQAGFGLALLLLLGGGYWLFFSGKEEPPAIIVSEEEAAPPAAGPEIANTPPQALSGRYQLPAGGGEVAILLRGQDAENDSLAFEITTPPQHGELSGEPPNLSYTPDKDFPGEDQFAFRASDGRESSEAGTIVIAGPDLSVAQAPPRTITPKRPLVAAEDVTIEAVSTDAVVIDWRDIWKKANQTDFPAGGVEIVSKELHGSLSRIDATRYRYQPDPYFSGTETITYRFRKGTLRSKERTLRLAIAMGDPPPDIRFSGLAPGYEVGSQVVLDASPTRDDARDTVVFSWQQVAGVPLQFRTTNQEGSAISFVVPSTFSGAADPVLRLVAVDQSGQRQGTVVTINTVSRHAAALWRGTGEGGVALEPDCPHGKCPGELLPWPYPD